VVHSMAWGVCQGVVHGNSLVLDSLGFDLAALNQ